MYSQSSLTYQHQTAKGLRQGGYEEDSPFGIFLGGEARVYGQFSVGTEIRLVNPTGASLSIAYDF